MMQRAFDRLSERAEWFVSRWWGFSSIALLVTVLVVRLLWDEVDRFTYLSGYFLLLMLVGLGRREFKALHAKIDTLTEGDRLDRLEERAEREIEEARNLKDEP